MCEFLDTPPSITDIYIYVYQLDATDEILFHDTFLYKICFPLFVKKITPSRLIKLIFKKLSDFHLH